MTGRVLSRQTHSSREFISRLSNILVTTTDIRTLLSRVAEEIAATLKTDQAFFYVRYGETHHISVGTKHHAALPLEDVAKLDDFIKGFTEAVVVTDKLEGNYDGVRRLLVSHKIELLMPLARDDEIIGYLIVGPPRTRDYSRRDVKMLGQVADELVIAIQNALSMQEIRDLNAHLQQRISTATSELRRTNARLRRLDEAKDEFISMASHQLRTPLTSVKGYISMVLEGDIGKISASQKRVLEEAFTSSERMVHLIHDFLNVSRLQTGKFTLELEQTDLANLVQEEVDTLQRVAKSRDMKITYKTEIKSVPLLLDDTKIRQVIINYIDNAIYYSKPDTNISVDLTEEKGDIVLRVTDTGIGVPPSEQAGMFDKFFRASNARKQRPDGTGVGLYLAKKVITSHGGDVFFVSKEGQGSTFGFRLPIDQNRALLEKNSAE
jgi:signal transduction histidine kinase